MKNKTLTTILIGLNVLDLITTKIILLNGGMELNPIINFLTNISGSWLLSTLAFKLILIGFPSYCVYKYDGLENNVWVKRSLYFSVILFTIALLINSWSIIFTI